MCVIVRSNVLAFFSLNRLTCFCAQFLSWSHMSLHTDRHTHTLRHTLIQRVRKEGTMPLFPPPSSKDVFFFSSALPDFLGGVHCPLCPKALSLYLPLSYSPSPSFTGHKGRGRGQERSLSPGPGGPRGGTATKERRNREGGSEKGR